MAMATAILRALECAYSGIYQVFRDPMIKLVTYGPVVSAVKPDATSIGIYRQTGIYSRM